MQLIALGNARLYMGDLASGSISLKNNYSGILFDQNDSLSTTALTSTSASIKVYSPKIKLDSNVTITGSLTTTGSVKMSGLSNSTTSNVIYYDTTTGALTYGAGASNAFPYTGSAQITGSLGVTGSFNVYNYDIYSGTYYTNIDTTNQQIQKVFGIGIDPQPGTVIDWGDETLSSFNSFGVSDITVNWGTKILYTAGSPFGNNKPSVDWGNRYLRYSNTTTDTPPISINWGAGTLNDTNGAVALEWDVPGTLTVSASMVLSASVTASSGNSATSDAILQATLLYLSNNF
jgi:hypothetical protein